MNKIKILTAIIVTIYLSVFFVFPASAEKKVLSIDTDASCITSSCHAGMAKKKYIHVPAGEGESCVTCHEVLKDGEHGFKLTSEVETLCFTCHDDVADKKFKHVPVKNGECLVCHDPHQSDNPKQLVADASELCFTCHDDVADKKFKHVPVKNGECLVCHDPHQSDNPKQLLADPSELCFTCHDDVADKKFKHVPVENGECTACHNPHQSDNPKQLLAPPTSELCFMCHDADEFKGSTPHGPVTEGECLECHHQHTSDYRAQLKNPEPELCFGCHGSDLEDYNGVTIPSPKDTYEDKKKNLHKPFAEGRCTACHLAHPANTYRLLKEPYPSEFYAAYSDKTYGICLKCHKNLNKVLSSPRTLTDTNFRNGDLNLHYRHVSRVKGRTCRACHQHHGSKNPGLIRETFAFGKRTLTIKYEKTDTGGSCSPACHVTVRYDRNEPVFNYIRITQSPDEDANPEVPMSGREKERKGR